MFSISAYTFLWNRWASRMTTILTRHRKLVWIRMFRIWEKYTFNIMGIRNENQNNINLLPPSWLIQQTTNGWYSFFIFPRKQDLAFHANCLRWGQFAWNVKFCCYFLFIFFFFEKKKQNNKNILICRLLKFLCWVLSVKEVKMSKTLDDVWFFEFKVSQL